MKRSSLEITCDIKIRYPKERGWLDTALYWAMAAGMWASFTAMAMEEFPLWGAAILATLAIFGFHCIARDYHKPRFVEKRQPQPNLDPKCP